MAASKLPSVFTPYLAAAAKSMIVSIRFVSDAQLKCKLDVPSAECVNEGIDFPSRCSADPIFNPIPIRNGNYAVIGEPLVIRVAGQADHVGPGIPANCTAMEPTPPAAPETTTVSPALRATLRTAA